MNGCIKDIVEQYLIRKGGKGKAELCAVLGRSESTFSRWLSHGIPTAHDAYRLALACGCDEAEALRLAKKEHSALKAKESVVS